MSMSKKKFLRITLLDNDFLHELSLVSHYLAQLINYDKEDRLNKIQEMPEDTLKEFVTSVLIATVRLESAFGSSDYYESLDDYIRKHIKVYVCDEDELSLWGNDENCYITLSDSLYEFRV